MTSELRFGIYANVDDLGNFRWRPICDGCEWAGWPYTSVAAANAQMDEHLISKDHLCFELKQEVAALRAERDLANRRADEMQVSLQAQAESRVAEWHEMADNIVISHHEAEIERLRAALKRISQGGCQWMPKCPDRENNEHSYRCSVCVALEALEGTGHDLGNTDGPPLSAEEEIAKKKVGAMTSDDFAGVIFGMDFFDDWEFEPLFLGDDDLGYVVRVPWKLGHTITSSGQFPRSDLGDPNFATMLREDIKERVGAIIEIALEDTLREAFVCVGQDDDD